MIDKNLLAEFETIKKGKNPKITADMEAVVVLSGESGDPDLTTELHDTEERMLAGIKIFKAVSKSGGNPVLILTGTSAQNKLMKQLAHQQNIKNIFTLKNIPPVPAVSTYDQFRELGKLPFKKIGIVTHAYHGPRSRRYAKKYLPRGCQSELLLIGRDKIDSNQIQEETKKIIKYGLKGDLDI